MYSAISSVRPHPTYDAKLSNANGYNRGHAELVRNVTTNAMDGGAKIYVGPASGYDHQATLPCGPALRLTAGHARLSGAAWYRRMQNVREGFDTTFTFRISSPSTQCRFLHDEYTHCRSRGADGFAFVVEAQHAQALGGGFDSVDRGSVYTPLQALTLSPLLLCHRLGHPHHTQPHVTSSQPKTMGWKWDMEVSKIASR